MVVLLMWLYSTGASVFIGGEANSEIEKAGAKARHLARGWGKSAALARAVPIISMALRCGRPRGFWRENGTACAGWIP